MEPKIDMTRVGLWLRPSVPARCGGASAFELDWVGTHPLQGQPSSASRLTSA